MFGLCESEEGSITGAVGPHELETTSSLIGAQAHAVLGLKVYRVQGLDSVGER